MWMPPKTHPELSCWSQCAKIFSGAHKDERENKRKNSRGRKKTFCIEKRINFITSWIQRLHSHLQANRYPCIMDVGWILNFMSCSACFSNSAAMMTWWNTDRQWRTRGRAHNEWRGNMSRNIRTSTTQDGWGNQVTCPIYRGKVSIGGSKREIN